MSLLNEYEIEVLAYMMIWCEEEIYEFIDELIDMRESSLWESSSGESSEEEIPELEDVIPELEDKGVRFEFISPHPPDLYSD